MSENLDLVKQFMEIVSCTEEQAKFCLEANNWDLDAALTSYYEDPQTPEKQELLSSEQFQTNSVPIQSSEPSSDLSSDLKREQPTSDKGKNQSARFTTLGDLGKDHADEDDDQDEPENLFAGGEKSGIFMQNPNVKASSSLIEDILRKAAEAGHGSAEEPTAPVQASRSLFSGTGYKLGSDDEPSVVIPSPSANSQTAPEESVVRHLTFWRNGFSIEDGPLMTYDDPANQEFLNAINSGRAPHLLNVKQGQPVNVNVERKLDEDYKPPPKKPAKPFSGSGQRLGSVAPYVSASSSSTQPQASSSTSASASLRTRQLELDESLPVTSIQIRMSDGTRMLARFNHDHTVGDIREFINASRIGEVSRNYVLQTTFPTKDLTDETQTLIKASLLNSVVVQRYI